MFFVAFYSLVPVLFLIALIYGRIAIGVRREPDPTGRRAYAIYLTSVVFIAIVAGFVSVAGVGAKAVDFMVRDDPAGISLDGSSGECTTSGGETICREGFEGGEEFGFTDIYPNQRTQDRSALFTWAVVLLVALGLLRWHWDRLIELKNEPGFDDGPARATYAAYVYLTVFTALAVAVIAAITGLLALGDAVSPDTFTTAPRELARDDAYSQIVAALLGGGAAFLVLRYHWDEGRGLRGEGTPTPEPEGA